VDWNQTLERVRQAAEFCTRSGLARLKVEDDDCSIEIRRTPRPSVPIGVEPAPAAGAPASANGVTAVSREVVLKAEFVGIVRFSHPAVAEGAVLAAPRELAYVESLGIRNPVRSLSPGRVSGVFVTDGEAVEYGQPLFSLEPGLER